MTMLSSIFGAAVATRNAMYDRGLLGQKRLERPVVSVGNLSVGGSGKTPFIILLGELLKKRGIAFDVLSRGYGRRSRGVRVVDPGGLAEEFGDEPLLIARRLQAPVVVGEQRYDAGLVAEQQFPSRLHLLDDGFQHRELARDFDIVLVTPEDARDRLLPSGRLREPPEALQRADVAVLASGAQAEEFPQARRTWRVRRALKLDQPPQRPVAFCGIARPQQFFAQLRKAGVEPVAEVAYRDHHRYAEGDVLSLVEIADKAQAGGFVTTEKDAVNLGGLFSALNPAVAQVTMQLEDAERAVEEMLETVAARKKD